MNSVLSKIITWPLQSQPSLIQSSDDKYVKGNHGIKGGMHTRSKVFSGALFAGDLGVVSTSRAAGLTRLLEIIEHEGASFNMKIGRKSQKLPSTLTS